MPKVQHANCPSCAGDLPVDATSDRVVCRYCGTTSFIAGRGHAPPNARLVVLGMPTGALIGLWVGAAAALLTLVGVIVHVATDAPPPALPAPARVVPTLPAIVPTPEPPPTPRVRVLSGERALLVEGTTASHRNIALPITVTLPGVTTTHYAVYDSRSFGELARTPALPDVERDIVASTRGRLIIARHDGQLVAYDLQSGREQWSTSLGERVAQLHTIANPDSLLVRTDGERTLAVDLLTGRQSETRERAGLLLGMTDRTNDPRDRRDYRAPPEIVAYRCGGVNVMGSANYRVADPCLARAHIDTDRLPGMVGHSLWQQDKDWLVFGVRAPGAYVPMLARLRKGKIVWKSEVPARDPLEAREGGPRFVALADGRLTLAYQTGREGRWWLTSFDAVSGARAYATELPKEASSITQLEAATDRVFVVAGERAYLASAADGKLLAVVGGKP